MIDIENKVVDTIQNAYTTASMNVQVVSVYTDMPTVFPCAMVRELSNATLRTTQDNSPSPHHATITYQIDFFSNKTSGAKSQVKQIFQVADTAMQNMNFTLTDFNLISNEERSITRGVARYSAIVGEGKTVGTTTTHHIYRR